MTGGLLNKQTTPHGSDSMQVMESLPFLCISVSPVGMTAEELFSIFTFCNSKVLKVDTFDDIRTVFPVCIKRIFTGVYIS